MIRKGQLAFGAGIAGWRGKIKRFYLRFDQNYVRKKPRRLMNLLMKKIPKRKIIGRRRTKLFRKKVTGEI